MAKWTPVLIQGGKTDDTPKLDPETDAFLQAFIRAGLEEEQYRHITFMQEEPRSQTVVSGELPKALFGLDIFGSPVIHFP